MTRRPGPWASALVLFVVAALCTMAQEICPPLGAVRLKPPLLVGAAVYWAFWREPGWAGFAAVALGALEDALGGVPFGTTALLVAPLAVAASVYLRPQLDHPLWLGALAGAALAPLMQFWQYLALRFFGGYAPLPFGALLLRIAGAVPAGALAALVACAAAAGLDWLTGNIGFEKEEEDGGA